VDDGLKQKAAYPWCSWFTTPDSNKERIRLMDTTAKTLRLATAPAVTCLIDQIVRDGARQMLQAAIEREVADYIDQHVAQKDADGHRLVVRNGFHPARSIQTGAGSRRKKGAEKGTFTFDGGDSFPPPRTAPGERLIHHLPGPYPS
jgi:hypothetical protein